jgi:hypothetical protein
MFTILTVAAVLVAVPATAIDPVATPATPAGATVATPETKMVCKRQALTGTRFAKKICYSAAQWDEKAEADRRAMAEMTGNTVQRESGRN